MPQGPVLSRVGIVLLLLSVAFFFKYSIDQGWLVPAVRIAIGGAAGLALVVLGFQGAGRGEHLGMALAGGGIATFFITGYAAHQWYSLVPYWAAFGLLFLASALGVYLSLRSGRQSLAMVGLVGALATPLLLTPVQARVAGLALYVCLIVGTVAGIYLARAWRALVVTAAVTAWLALGTGVLLDGPPGGASSWVVQLCIVLCAVALWIVPVVRALLAASDPGRWPPPTPPEARYQAIPWSAHLDALSLFVPLAAIAFSAGLWDLPRGQVGWVFFGTALLARWFGWWVSGREDPEGSARTQSHVALLLFTVGLGLALSGDLLYLAFIVEAAVLLALGEQKRSQVLRGLGGMVQLVVVALFLRRMGEEGTLLKGDLSSLLDLAAVGGALLAATRLSDRDERGLLFGASYLGLLGWTARELLPLEGGQAWVSLAFGVEGTALLAVGYLAVRPSLQKVGLATLFMVVAKLLLVDLAAVEPIWRVLLFGVFGGLFLVLSRLAQGRRPGVTTPTGGDPGGAPDAGTGRTPR